MNFVSCVLMTEAGKSFDEDSSGRPLNKLPVKCSFCSFPDLDVPPSPYSLNKNAVSPAELAAARFGNFLVRDRLRRILEMAVPDACTFHPTTVLKGSAQDWWLAVPQHQRATGIPAPEPPFCPQCGEPKTWYFAMRDVWLKMKEYNAGGVDVFKSTEWRAGGNAEADYEMTNKLRAEDKLPPLPWKQWGITAPEHAGRWTRTGLDRDLYFSGRLNQLLERVTRKRNLVRYGGVKYAPLSSEEERWVNDKLALLRANGLVEGSTKGVSPLKGKDDKWLDSYIRKHPANSDVEISFDAVEKTHRIKVPVAFKNLVGKCGALVFDDIDGSSGLEVKLLTPNQMDFVNYRKGKIPHLDQEQSGIDGVTFAAGNNGDVFVFDVAATGANYPVYWYQHEENQLELFADSFSQCIRRFVSRAA